MRKSSGSAFAGEAPITEFCVNAAHSIAQRRGSLVRLSSQGRGWTSMYASVQHETPCEALFEACPHHLIILHLDSAPSRRFATSESRKIAGRGELFILPGGTSGEVRVDHPLESIHLYIHERVLREVDGTFGHTVADPARILARFGARDPFLEHLGIAVLDLLEREDCHSAVQAEFLARALAAHLLSKHSNRTASIGERRLKGSMTPVLNYMQVNFSRRLSIAELADIARLSEQQFSRRFKQLVGSTPHHHLLALRVERAKRMLQQELPIAEVAFECGFAHQEHLTHVFRRFTSLTPASYRREARLRTAEHANSLTQTHREMQ
jgi:AraC family transcriptional regulator